MGEPRQFVTFFLAGEEHAVPVGQVQEVLALGRITRVPTTPAWILGVANVRGSVLPVVDVAIKLGLPPTATGARSSIVVLESQAFGDRMRLGVVVESVAQVIELAPEDLEPPPSFGTRIRVEYLTGMARVGDAFVLLFDLEHALTAEELRTAAAVEAPAEPEGGEEAVG
jgi:purine-binding chemotaxis protein CheW